VKESNRPVTREQGLATLSSSTKIPHLHNSKCPLNPLMRFLNLDNGVVAIDGRIQFLVLTKGNGKVHVFNYPRH
jgi:hypothetical protein